MSDTLEFKARSSMVTCVCIPVADIRALDEIFKEKIAHSPRGFFVAAPMVADLGKIDNPTSNWLYALQGLFKKHGLVLIGLSNHHFAPEALAQVGLANIDFPVPRPNKEAGENKKKTEKPTAESDKTTEKPVKKSDPGQETVPSPPPPPPVSPSATLGMSPASVPSPPPPPPVSPAAIESASPPPQNKVVRGTVRSGQRIYAPGGDLTIIGTVGAGAEVIADGNIHIFGALRGRAFAGIKDDENAHIFAAAFNPELVSIAGRYYSMEELEPYKNGKNCLVTLNKDETMLIVSL